MRPCCHIWCVGLRLAGQAGILATEIALSVRSLRYVFSNLYAPGLHLLSGPADVPYQLEVSWSGCDASWVDCSSRDRLQHVDNNAPAELLQPWSCPLVVALNG
jgi:hypothetical protein